MSGDNGPVAVKIKLKRVGKMRNAQYRIVIADARTKRDGRAIEEIGIYQPKEEPSLIRVDSDRAQYWLGVGAQPTDAVTAILKVTGDWQKFKGLPGAEGTLRVAEPKVDKKTVFEAAALEAANEPVKEATTPKKKAAKAEEPVVEVVGAVEADGTDAAAEVVAEEAPAAEAAEAAETTEA
jgi:small subunit ribosomal protein S16